MRYILANALSICFLFAAVARAGDVADKSPEAVQKVVETALPDLLHFKLKEGYAALKKLNPDPQLWKIADLEAYSVQGQRAALHEQHGEPIDWKYLGVRKFGSHFREYTYLCRYQKRPHFWHFALVQKDGAWSLASYRSHTLDNNHLLTELRTDHQSVDAASSRLCDQVAQELAAGKTTGIDLFKQHCISDKNWNSRLDGELQAILLKVIGLGALKKCEQTQATDLGGLVSEFCYFVEYERGTAFFRFVLYRPGNEWKFLSYQFNTDLRVVTATATMEINPALYQTATLPEKNKSEESKTKLR